MLKINNVVLDERFIYNLINMQLESPRHRDLLIARQIDKMSHNFIDV
jgi:hypothetical protein